MRARFWRKKDARLVMRLNSVVETTERARLSMQPPPSKVVIDTTYLAGSAPDPQSAAPCELLPTDPVETGRGEAAQRAAEAERRLAAEREALRQEALSEAMRLQREADRERAQRLEAEAHREGLARAALEAEREALGRRLSEARSEIESLRQAIAERDAASREAEGLRSEVALLVAVEGKLRSDLRSALAARDEAERARTAHEAELDHAAARLADAEQELGDLRSAVEESARSVRREAEARLRTETARLEQSALSEVNARRAVEEERAAAAARLCELEDELAAMRASAADVAAAAARDREARARASEAQREVEARLRGQLADLQGMLDLERAARREAEADRDRAVNRASVAEAELEGLRRRAKDGAEAERQAHAALELVESMRGEHSFLAERLQGLEGELARRSAAARTVEVERDAAVRRLAEAEEQLAALREAVAQPEAPAPAASALSHAVSICVPAAPLPAEGHSPSPETSPPPAEVKPGPAAVAAAGMPARPGKEAPAHSDNRRDKRLDSRMPATLWREGMGQPLPCTIRDRSSSGAKLEFRPDKYAEGVTEFVVGEHLTLTISTAQERTFVTCLIVWIAGRRCGVQFAGQFRAESLGPKRGPVASLPSSRGPAQKAAKARPAAGRVGKSLFSA